MRGAGEGRLGLCGGSGLVASLGGLHYIRISGEAQGKEGAQAGPGAPAEAAATFVQADAHTHIVQGLPARHQSYRGIHPGLWWLGKMAEGVQGFR